MVTKSMMLGLHSKEVSSCWITRPEAVVVELHRQIVLLESSLLSMADCFALLGGTGCPAIGDLIPLHVLDGSHITMLMLTH